MNSLKRVTVLFTLAAFLIAGANTVLAQHSMENTAVVSCQTQKSCLCSEIKALKKQVSALQKKLARLETKLSKNKQKNKAPEDTSACIDLNGEWKLTDIMEDSLYKGMELGFKVYFLQNGNTFTAYGDKYWENGKEIVNTRRVPLRITGIIEGNTVRGIYFEDDRPVRSCGEFVWTIQSPTKLTGIYSSSFADTKGKSILIKAEPAHSFTYSH